MPLKYYNNPPYYDDFDQAKNYVRILFRPGHAVQARELTQMQTALQAQIDRHGRHIFKEGSPVLGGNVFLDKIDYVKVESSFVPQSGGMPLITDNYYEEFIDTIVTGQTSGVSARVIDVLPSNENGPVTLYVKYIDSGSNQTTKTFVATEELFSDADIVRKAKVKIAAETPIGLGLRFSINESVFFVNGNFVYAGAESLMLSRYATEISTRVVYQVVENIVTIAEDSTLGDNALGSPNEAAPGAHRYQILLNLETQPFDFSETRDPEIIQLMVIENGRIKERARTEYSELANTLAERTFEESGNYTVRPFLLNVREFYDNGINNGLYTLPQIRNKYELTSETDNQVISYGQQRLALGLEKSVAYVNGYRIELEDVKYIDLLKSRSTAFFNGASIVANLGNYVFVDLSQSLPDIDNFTLLNLRNQSSTTIGTARVRSFEYVTGTLYKLYLFDINMYSGQIFGSVRSVQQSVPGGAQFIANINMTYGARLYETNNNSLVYQLPFSTVKTLVSAGQNDTFYISKRTAYNIAVTSSTATITASDGVIQAFNTSDWLATVTTTGAKVTITGVSLAFNVSTGVSTATVTFSGFSTGNVNIQYPIEKNLIQKTKTLVSQHQISVTSPNTTPGGYDSLGVTDVLKVYSIKDLSIPVGSSFLDITDRYEIDNGQRENFYDIARIRLKPGSIAPTGNLQIVMDYFQHSSGDYFSVDSYSSIDYENIPAFTTSKGRIELRDAIDFRPTKDITGNNFTGTGASTSDIIKPGSVIKTDITYYLNRIDKIYVDKYGEFGILRGTPALNPEPPSDLKDSMVLYEVYVSAFTFGPQSVVPKMIDNKRYTMRDIGKLERRIKNLEYYTSLSLLEKETAEYQIAPGSFKNGFIVDSFYGHNVGNPSHPDYSVSTDKNRGILRPQFAESEVRLKLDTINSSGIRQTGPLVTLDYTEVPYIEQPYASYAEYINPYNIFSWTGDMVLSPESDNWKDTDSRPEVIIDQEGIFDSFKDLADAAGVTGTVWNEWQTNWSGVTASSSSSRTFMSGNAIVRGTTTITTVQTDQTRSGVRTEVVPDTITTDLGERVVEVNFVPFIRSRIVSFKAERLKPNTRLFAFFDGKDITGYCTKTDQFFTFNDFTNANPNYTSGYTFNGESAWPNYISTRQELVTDATGTITGFFIVPNNDLMRFRTGQRIFKLCDNIDNNINAITTSAEAVYEAAGLLESRENVVLSTRVPRIDRTMLGESRVLTNTTSRTTNQVIGWVDPLAQTIMVDTPGGIFATSIDLYFESIDEEVPVTVHLVTTEVGLPTTKIVPFSKSTRLLNSLNTSDDATVATRFQFEAPVHLQQGVEYAIVILSMSDKPKVWVSEMGAYDVTNPDYRISKQPYAGVFFKSQNASTWTPEQEKDLKFKLNRADFVSNSAEVYLENVNVQPTLLKNDPILTQSGSNLVKVFHKNHGLFEGSRAVISGIAATSGSVMNGIPVSELNKQHDVIRVEPSFFVVQVTTNANTTGRAGGASVLSTGNRLMNLMQLSVEQLVVPGTSLDWQSRVTSARSFAGVEQVYVTSQFFPIIANQNTIFSRPQCIPTPANQPGGVPGFVTKGMMSTSRNTLSPVIDLDRVSVFCISNIIDHPSSTPADGRNFVDTFVPETSATGGSALSKYITRRVSLAEDANQIKVIISINRPSGSDVELYYKVQGSEDSNFDNLPWVLQNPDDPIPLTEDPNAYSEVEYSIDDELNGVEFSSMAFKIVLKTQNSSFVPTCRDFRAIAIYN